MAPVVPGTSCCWGGCCWSDIYAPGREWSVTAVRYPALAGAHAWAACPPDPEPCPARRPGSALCSWLRARRGRPCSSSTWSSSPTSCRSPMPRARSSCRTSSPGAVGLLLRPAVGAEVGGLVHAVAERLLLGAPATTERDRAL